MIDWILVTDLTLITLNLWLGWDIIKLIQTEEGNIGWNRWRISAHFILAGLLISKVLMELVRY